VKLQITRQLLRIAAVQIHHGDLPNLQWI
jgi:hypothetical protein